MWRRSNVFSGRVGQNESNKLEEQDRKLKIISGNCIFYIFKKNI